MNGNDEYTLEAALQLAEATGGDVTLLAMAPATGLEALRKGLAMGAARAVVVTDDALAGSCARSTIDVLAAALRELAVRPRPRRCGQRGRRRRRGRGRDRDDPGSAGRDRSRRASAAGEDRTLRVRRLAPDGEESVEVDLPALVVGTQLLGEPRYPTLKGIMGARSKEVTVRSLADLGLADGSVGGAAAATVVLAQRPPAARSATRVVREAPDVAAREIVALLVERRAI